MCVREGLMVVTGGNRRGVGGVGRVVKCLVYTIEIMPSPILTIYFFQFAKWVVMEKNMKMGGQGWVGLDWGIL